MEKKLFEVWKIGQEEYKLKLTTAEIERLERNYGTGNLLNPIINSSSELPALSYMLDIVHGAIQKFHHGYSRQDVTDLYDEYNDNGGSQTELLKVIIEIFKVSGFFPNTKSKKAK